MSDEYDAPEEQENHEAPAEDWKAKYDTLQAELETERAEARRLVNENKKYRERAQAAEFARLKTKFPALEQDDVAGLNADQIEKLLSKVTGQQDAVAEQTNEPATDPAVVEAAKSFVTGAGGQAPPKAEKISFAEAKARGGIRNPEIRALAAKGLVEGVDIPGLTP